MENFKYCDATPRKIRSIWVTGLSSGLVVYALLVGIGSILIRKQVSMLLSYRFHAKLGRLVPALTLVAAVAFIADAHQDRGSLVNCDSWGGLHWVAFLVNVCFLVRLFLNWCVTYRPQLLATVVDVWLLVQGCIALWKGYNLYAFTFLTIIRFFHSECLMAWSRLSTLVRTGSGLGLVMVLVAGALQVAEDYGTMYGSHATSQGTLQPIRSFWEYLYWTVVTISTVGYGEISPSTNAGKFVVIVTIILGIVWYATLAEKFSGVMKKYFAEGRYPLPDCKYPRVVILGESDPYNVMRLVKAVKGDDKEDMEIVLLMPGEVTHKYLPIRGEFPVKILSCTSLQEDLTNLMPSVYNYKYIEARERDAIVLFGDHEAEDPEAEDVRIVEMLVQARMFVPDRRYVVQVLLRRSRHAVQQTPHWSSRDVVVCLEELVVDVLAQTAACPAAASILSSLLKIPITSSTGSERPDVLPVSHFGGPQEIAFYQPNPNQQNLEDYLDAAFKLHKEQGDLLLGWFSVETQDFELLPEELPSGVVWIVISSGSATIQKPSVTAKNKDEECCDDPEEVTVSVSGVGSGHNALEAALDEFPTVRVLPQEEWSSASTLVMITAGMKLRYVIGAHYLRAHLAEHPNNTSGSESIRLLTDVYHGQGQRSFGQSSTSEVVNKSMIISAVGAAIINSNAYAIWRQLAANRNVVGVRVKRDCFYGEVFRELVVYQRMLPLGVKLVPEDESTVTNPPAALKLTPGALVFCLLVTLAPDIATLPSINISQGI